MRTYVAGGLVVAALVLTGCTSDGGPAAAPPSPSPSAAAYNDRDVVFVAGMRPHHAQAIEMSDIVLAADPPAQVAALARRISAAQAPEIEQLDRMLAAFGSRGGHGGHGDGHAGHGGMMTPEQLAELKAATGVEAGRLFLQLMIEHHEGALDAARDELENGTYEPARTLAGQIAGSQAAEIAEMKRLLEAL